MSVRLNLRSLACDMKPLRPGSCLPLHHLPPSQLPQALSFTHPQYFATSKYRHPRISSPTLCICHLPHAFQDPVLSPLPSVSSPWALCPYHPLKLISKASLQPHAYNMILLDCILFITVSSGPRTICDPESAHNEYPRRKWMKNTKARGLQDLKVHLGRYQEPGETSHTWETSHTCRVITHLERHHVPGKTSYTWKDITHLERQHTPGRHHAPEETLL